MLADEPEAALRELRRAAEKFGQLELPYATAQAQRRAAGAAARIGDKAARALADYARERLARYKVPKRFEFCELPKTSTGKIQKNVLRERAHEL